MSTLSVIPGGDYVTLVTCTPYGINTHRLLVRGTRVETIMDNTLHFTSEAMQIDTVLVAAVLCVPILILLIVYIFMSGSQRDAREREKIKNEAMKRILNHQSPVEEGNAKQKPESGKNAAPGKKRKSSRKGD